MGMLHTGFSLLQACFQKEERQGRVVEDEGKRKWKTSEFGFCFVFFFPITSISNVKSKILTYSKKLSQINSEGVSVDTSGHLMDTEAQRRELPLSMIATWAWANYFLLQLH